MLLPLAAPPPPPCSNDSSVDEDDKAVLLDGAMRGADEQVVNLAGSSLRATKCICAQGLGGQEWLAGEGLAVWVKAGEVRVNKHYPDVGS